MQRVWHLKLKLHSSLRKGLLMHSLDNQYNKHTTKWIEVAKVVAIDLNAKVKCPICNQATLVIWDEYWKRDKSRWERHMRCPRCEAKNSILMTSAFK